MFQTGVLPLVPSMHNMKCYAARDIFVLMPCKKTIAYCIGIVSEPNSGTRRSDPSPLRSTRMRERRSRGAQETSVPTLPFSLACFSRFTLAHRNAAKSRGNQLLTAKRLVTLSACLMGAFVVSFVIEAFDSDLDLWPFGTEDFGIAAHTPSLAGTQLPLSSAALNGFSCFVRTAGAHLIAQHRARSALAADIPNSSSLLIECEMAEPWRQDLKDAPVLGHGVLVGHDNADDRGGRWWSPDLGKPSRV
jgi:hypothetical protein